MMENMLVLYKRPKVWNIFCAYIFVFLGKCPEEWILFSKKYLESVELEKFDWLVHQINRNHQKLRGINAVFFDEVNLPQPIDSKSIVRLSCFTSFGIGSAILLVYIILRCIPHHFRFIQSTYFKIRKWHPLCSI